MRSELSDISERRPNSFDLVPGGRRGSIDLSVNKGVHCLFPRSVYLSGAWDPLRPYKPGRLVPGRIEPGA